MQLACFDKARQQTQTQTRKSDDPPSRQFPWHGYSARQNLILIALLANWGGGNHLFQTLLDRFTMLPHTETLEPWPKHRLIYNQSRPRSTTTTSSTKNDRNKKHSHEWRATTERKNKQLHTKRKFIHLIVIHTGWSSNEQQKNGQF